MLHAEDGRSQQACQETAVCLGSVCQRDCLLPGSSSTIRAVCLGEQIKSESLEATMKTKENWHLLCVSTSEQSVELDISKCVFILLSVRINAMKLVCLAL